MALIRFPASAGEICADGALKRCLCWLQALPFTTFQTVWTSGIVLLPVNDLSQIFWDDWKSDDTLSSSFFIWCSIAIVRPAWIKIWCKKPDCRNLGWCAKECIFWFTIVTAVNFVFFLVWRLFACTARESRTYKQDSFISTIWMATGGMRNRGLVFILGLIAAIPNADGAV
jgi:hypothetical protein